MELQGPQRSPGDTGMMITHPSSQETVGFKALVPISPFTIIIFWKFKYFRAEIFTEREGTQVISSSKLLRLGGKKSLLLYRTSLG